jgi:uncharacterized protein YbjT (DUF2867 family)
LLKEDSVSRVVSLGRRSTGRQDPKLTEIEFTAFGDAGALAPHVTGIDTAFHCLATYSSRVSRESYEDITVDWLSALLVACQAASPGMTFCLFSAQGARPDGGGMSFALQMKGRAENALFASGTARTFAFRPGYIAPSGPMNTWKPADYLFKPLQRLLPSIGVTSDELAKAMLKTAINDPRQSAVLENGDMRELLAC